LPCFFIPISFSAQSANMPYTPFTIATLAAYLHLTPAQVEKLAERGDLPGRKVGGEWRFSKVEVHHWLETRIGVSGETELVRMEDALDRHITPAEPEEVSVSALLPLDAIALPLAARTRNSVIRGMARLAADTGLLWDPEAMAQAVLDREEMHPTALENGVALLHPRRPLPSILAEPVLALGITGNGIPFGGGGGGLTDVFFLICSTEDRGHLRLLARLSRLIGLEGFLTALRAAENAGAARQVITDAEAEL